MNKKILFHYLLSLSIYILAIYAFELFFRHIGCPPSSFLENLIRLYGKFIDCMFYGTAYRYYYLLRIITYGSLVLLIITHIAFIRKQNKFTIAMFYFWNNIFFSIPNPFLFSYLNWKISWL